MGRGLTELCVLQSRSVLVRVASVGAGLGKQPHALGMAVRGGVDEGGAADAALGLERGAAQPAALQQRGGGVGQAVLRRGHQRGGAAGRGRVHRRAAPQQHRHRGGVPAPRRQQQQACEQGPAAEKKEWGKV